MNGRTLGILALIAVVAIGAALLVQSNRSSRGPAPAVASGRGADMVLSSRRRVGAAPRVHRATPGTSTRIALDG